MLNFRNAKIDDIKLYYSWANDESVRKQSFNSKKIYFEVHQKWFESKIQDAAYSLKAFGTMTKQASFINGAKWAIHNLTDAEIKHMRENSDSDDHSFFGL